MPREESEQNQKNPSKIHILQNIFYNWKGKDEIKTLVKEKYYIMDNYPYSIHQSQWQLADGKWFLVGEPRHINFGGWGWGYFPLVFGSFP